MLVCVYNCNGVTDDNFDLYLNGSFVAHFNETILGCHVDRCRGHLVIPTGFTGRPSPASCPTCVGPDNILWENVIESPVMEAPTCPLNFELRSTSNNGCNNFGMFEAYRVCSGGTDPPLKLVYSSPYNMASFGSNFYTVGSVCPCSSSSSSSSSESSSSSLIPSSSSSSYGSCTDVDHGCGQQGWVMGDDGIWAWDGEIVCDCGTPNYPTFGSPPGTHTTTYCCAPVSSSSSLVSSSSRSSSSVSSSTSSTSSSAAMLWQCDIGFCDCFQADTGTYATEAECMANCCAGTSSASSQTVYWHCDKGGVCVETFIPEYTTQAECEANCAGGFGMVDAWEWAASIPVWSPSTSTSTQTTTKSTHTYIINLDRRQDRWATVSAALQKEGVAFERWRAVDGSQCTIPATWKSSPGHYGCWQSHRALLDHAIASGFDMLHVLEDDAELFEGYSARLAKLVADVERVDPNWDAIFVGGEHTEPPEQTNDPGIVKCTNTVRMHDYLVRRHYFQRLRGWWENIGDHCDWVWGQHHRESRVYAPANSWLSGQGAGMSDTEGVTVGARTWQAPTITQRPVEARKPCGCGGQRQIKM